HMCGRVVWLKNPTHKSKSGRPICGTQILGDLHRAPNNTWESGWIYNPEDEERFSAEIHLKNESTLLVTGYLGIKLLGETFTWKRAPASFRERCAQHRATYLPLPDPLRGHYSTPAPRGATRATSARSRTLFSSQATKLAVLSATMCRC